MGVMGVLGSERSQSRSLVKRLSVMDMTLAERRNYVNTRMVDALLKDDVITPDERVAWVCLHHNMRVTDIIRLAETLASEGYDFGFPIAGDIIARLV